jgi:hypothetical protein
MRQMRDDRSPPYSTRYSISVHLHPRAAIVDAVLDGVAAVAAVPLQPMGGFQIRLPTYFARRYVSMGVGEGTPCLAGTVGPVT